MSYEQRLDFLSWMTVRDRMIRGDMIEVFKMFNGLEKVDWRRYFALNDCVTRGNDLKLYKIRVNSERAKGSFIYRIVDEWNKLSNAVVLAPSLQVFKCRYQDYYRLNRGLSSS